MKCSPLWPFFLISLFFTLFSKSFLPFCSLISFAPFIALLMNRFSFQKSLWISLLCGLIVDLTSGEFPFGLYALNYTLTTFCLYRLRLYFIAKSLGLCFLTLLFSLLATLFQRGFCMFFGQLLPFNWRSVLTDFIFMPLIDAFYAFLWFSCPLILYTYLRKQSLRFLIFRQEHKKKKKFS